jgi:tape measure domain-containing protein
MSKTVDNRVLEMRFDNQQFEKGVAQSMSTLDKLKQKLNFTGASKGLESINAASKGINFNGITSGVDALRVKFSALQVAGVTAMQNITNSVMNTGKHMMSAITTDPIRDGFREYETQINAVQTILANTQKEGTNVEIVNKALDELNTYADKTIYNFTEMTRNIGTFTAAGVKLGTSVNAIQGIANLAAVSGSKSQQASVAMYQLSQALAAGTVKLMDWNSVVNAGMGGQVFQDALTETSEKLNTGAKAAIAAEGSFRESLKTGWLTSEVLTETLKKFTTSGATEYVAEYTDLSKDAVESILKETDAWGKNKDAIDKAAKALAEKSGKSEEEIKNILQFAKTAQDAATKVKTFTQLIDTLKEALGSGWTQTWRLIIGDFEDAKELWTNVSDFFSDIINKSAETRNKIVEKALGSPFTKLVEKINSVTTATETVTEATKNFDEIVTQVIRGNFGNGQKRYDALTKAGYDWAYIQNKVNERLGDSTRHATDFKESTDKLNKSQAETVETLLKMSDAKLKDKGFTDQEIKAFRELEEQSKKTGVSIEEIFKDSEKLSGRNLAIDSFKNAAKGIVTICTSIKDAWKTAFWGDSTEDEIIETKAQAIYSAIGAMHKFSQSLVVSKETADNVKRTFAGLFSILDMMTTLTGGGLKLGFKILSSVLSQLHLNIFEVTAIIGDALVKIHDVILNNGIIATSAKAIISVVQTVISTVKSLYNTFSNMPVIQQAIEKITEAFNRLSNIDLSSIGKRIMSGITGILGKFGFESVGTNITSGIQNGLISGAGSVISTMMEIATSIINAICDILQIHSPSRKMQEIGKFAMEGLCNGIKDGSSKIWTVLSDIGSKILEWASSIDWSKVFAFGVAVGIIVITKQLADAVTNFSKAFAGFGNVMNAVANVINGFDGVLDGIKAEYKSKALKNLAISIGILTACIVAIAQLPIAEAWNAVAIITVLSGLLIGLSFAVSKMSDASISIGKKGANIEGLKTGLIQIGVALIALAAIVKLIGSMSLEQAVQGFAGLTILMAELLIFLKIMGKVGKSKGFENTDGMTTMMVKLAVALGLMAVVVKLISTLSAEQMLQGAAFALAFTSFAVLMGVAARIAGPFAETFGKMVKRLTISMALMVGVCKLVDLLSVEEMLKGAAFVTVFVVFIGLLAKVTKFAGSNTDKLGLMLLSISFSMTLMVGICKLAGMLSEDEMKKGAAFAAAFLIFVAALKKVTTISNTEQTAKLTATILAMTIAIAGLAAISIALSLVDIPSLAKGIVAVGLLGAILAGMIQATKGASDVKGSIIAMAVAIGVMAVSVVALSFIDPSRLAGATAALGILMGMFAYIEKSAPFVRGSISTIITMVAVVGLLTGVLVAMSMLNVQNAVQNAAGLGILMLALGESMKLIGSVGRISSSAISALGVMTLIMTALAAILGIMSYFNVEASLINVAAMSVLMLTLAGTLRIIDGVGRISGNTLITMSILAGIMAAMGAIVGLLDHYNIGPSLETAEALSVLMISLSTACLIMSAASSLAITAAAGIKGLLAIIVLMGALMTGIGYLSSNVPSLEKFLEKALPILKLIGAGIGEFLGGILYGIGDAVLSLLPKLGQALSSFGDNVAPFCEMASSIDSGVAKGIGFLSLAILELTAANLIAGIGQFLSFGSNFATLGTQLSTFGDGVTPFLETLNTIKPESVQAAKNLADMILTLTKADFLSSIGEFLGFGTTDFSKFGESCKAFAEAVKDMSSVLTGENGEVLVNDSAINSLCKAGEALSKLYNSLPKQGGWVQKIVGEQDLKDFGTSCEAFAESIKSMSSTLTGENGSVNINESAVESLCKAGTLINELYTALPKTDGWVQKIVGEQDLKDFGTSCEAFAESMKTISDSLTTVKGDSLINEEVVESVKKAGEMLLELNEALPDEGGGIFAAFSSKVDLSDFGGQITNLASGLSDFASKTENIDTDSLTTVIEAVNKLTTIADLINGTNFSNVNNFAQVSQVGTAMSAYYDEVAGVDAGVITKTVNSAIKLRDLIVNLSGLDTSGIANFKVEGLGQAMQSYANAVAGMDTTTVGNSIVNIRSLMNLINDMSGMDSSGVDSFKSAVTNLNGLDLSGVAKSFTSSASQFNAIGIKFTQNIGQGLKSGQSQLIATGTVVVTALANTMRSRSSMFHAIGVTLMNKFVAGMRSQNSSIASSATGALNLAASRLRSYYGIFRGAGGYVASGFAAGIRSGIQAAANAAAQMASAASTAARKNLKVASPSKVFKKIGGYVSQGFAIGISNYASMVQRSVGKMTNTAVDTSNKAMTRILEAVNGSVDSQPSIRPVVDLSEAKTGIHALNAMLNTADQSIGVRADLSGISYNMNTRNQNGSNSDVVNAINKLRSDLGNMERNSYTINGITYDDGSNIAGAITQIVQAARIGGRA